VSMGLVFADYDAVSVKDSRFAAVGDGATDDTVALQAALDFCFGPADAQHGTASVYQNKAVYIPPGHYKTTAPLTVKYLHGARIIGAGRFVTHIENVTPGSSVLATNGCGYSRFEGMRLTAAAGGESFDLDWDGSAGGPALQSNTFCRHVLRWRVNRRRDRPFRLHGVGESVSQLLLAGADDCGIAHVECKRAAADRDRWQLSGLQSRELRGRRLGADGPRPRLPDLCRLRHLHWLAFRQRHERAGLPQRKPKLHQQCRRPIAARGRLQPRWELERLFSHSARRLRSDLCVHLESRKRGPHLVGHHASRKQLVQARRLAIA